MSAAPAGRRPVTVTASFVIWLINVVLGLLSAVVLLGFAGTVEAAGEDVSVTGAGPTAELIAAIVVIVLSVIQLVVVFQMRAGKNWARIVLAVLAGLQIISAVVAAGTTDIAGWIGLAVVVIAAVLMFVPASNPYFGHRSRTGA